MIHKYKCQLCGKIIEDISKGRFEYNKEQHINKHIRKEKKEDEKK